MKSHPLPGMQSSIRVGPSGGTVTEPPNKPPPPLPKKQPSYVNITKVSILSININIQKNTMMTNKLLLESNLQQTQFHFPNLRIVLETYWMKWIAFKTDRYSSLLVLRCITLLHVYSTKTWHGLCIFFTTFTCINSH